MTPTRAAALLLTVVLLAGCGGAASSADRNLRAYFDDIATQTVGSLRSAVHLAAAGSPAAAYATYLQASTEAAKDGGQSIDPHRRTAERTDKGFRFCQGSETDHVCYEYTTITRRGGLVSDFSINGRPVANRLAVGDGSQAAFKGVDGKAGFVAAYQTTATRKLFVVVRVMAGAGATLQGVGASYRGPDGVASTSTATLGRAHLTPGSSGSYLFAFASAPVGGTITVTASSDGRHGSVALVAGPGPAS